MNYKRNECKQAGFVIGRRYVAAMMEVAKVGKPPAFAGGF